MATKIVIPNEDFSANSLCADKDYELANGYASAPTSTQVEIDNNASSNLIRVRTNELYGKFYIKTNTGYVIRAIVYYDTSVDYSTAGVKASTGVTSVGSVQGTTEYTFNTSGKYACITFCKTDSTAAISATEDIVAEFYYI